MNPGSLDSHEQYLAGFHFGFPLVSDPDRTAARAYGALKPDGNGILRTVYLVGTDGRIRFAARGAPGTAEILASLG
jgi:thioredoxin-dependent peroxiredoxin